MADQKDDLTLLEKIPPFEHPEDSEADQLLTFGSNLNDLSDDVTNDSIVTEISSQDEVVTISGGEPELPEKLMDMSDKGTEEDDQLNFDASLNSDTSFSNMPDESSFNMTGEKDISEFLEKCQQGEFLEETQGPKDLEMEAKTPPPPLPAEEPQNFEEPIALPNEIDLDESDESNEETTSYQTETVDIDFSKSIAPEQDALVGSQQQPQQQKTLPGDPPADFIDEIGQITESYTQEQPFIEDESEGEENPIPSENNSEMVTKPEISFSEEMVDVAPLVESESDNLSEDNLAQSPQEKTLIHSTDHFQSDQTPLPKVAPKETFEDIREFSEDISITKERGQSSPAFSIILKNIKYVEDANAILEMLKEYGIINPENEQIFSKGLYSGSALLSRLSEYSAIFLAHKFRRFHLDLMMGLSDEIRPPKESSLSASKGPVSKSVFQQNRQEFVELQGKIDPSQVIVTTAPTLCDRKIKHYIGVVSEHIFVELENLESHVKELKKDGQMPHEQGLSPQSESDPVEMAKYEASLSEIYDSLANKLRVKALKMNGNAVVGIIYQITPLLMDKDKQVKTSYKVTCTGSVVQVM